MDVIVILFILIGVSVLVMAIIRTYRIFHLLDDAGFRKGWRRLQMLMSLFLVGYIGSVYIIYIKDQAILQWILAVIFLFGAVFVYKVVSLGIEVFDKLRATNKNLGKQMQILKSRNEQLTQAIYATTHDLREPINTVLGCSNLMTNYDSKLEPEAKKLIHFSTKAADRMAELVSAMADYLSVGIGSTREYVNTSEILEEVIESMNGSVLKSNAHIKIKNLPSVNANKNELKRVFQNLISNAIKYRRVEVDPQIEISSTINKDKKWQFEVRDNGIGIKEKDIPKAFQLFRQLHPKETYEGMGLGLSIVRRVVELHGGKVWMQSQYGEGTSFFFTLDNGLIMNEMLK
ncbi:MULTISPECIES: HAMP domain-containing sensor histidine kinase [unclassified Ekhidna]|jgi:signal transduction histidine kinase|uniref:sensor histidine kinase n=1 Tax=unclassified Ekhidna TaxID=2632188 RepID=UPI0032DECC8E